VTERLWQEALYEDLLANTAIKAAVGARIYKGARPQKAAFPCLVYETIADPSEFAGAVVWGRVQFTIAATTPDAAESFLLTLKREMTDYGHHEAGLVIDDTDTDATGIRDTEPDTGVSLIHWDLHLGIKKG